MFILAVVLFVIGIATLVTRKARSVIGGHSIVETVFGILCLLASFVALMASEDK